MLIYDTLEHFTIGEIMSAYTYFSAGLFIVAMGTFSTQSIAKTAMSPEKKIVSDMCVSLSTVAYTAMNGRLENVPLGRVRADLNKRMASGNSKTAKIIRGVILNYTKSAYRVKIPKFKNAAEKRKFNADYSALVFFQCVKNMGYNRKEFELRGVPR